MFSYIVPHFNFSHLCFFILQNFEGHFNCTLIYKLLTWPHSATHSRLDVRLSISAFVLWKGLISRLLSVECSTNEISDWEKDFFIWNYFPQRTNVVCGFVFFSWLQTSGYMEQSLKWSKLAESMLSIFPVMFGLVLWFCLTPSSFSLNSDSELL